MAEITDIFYEISRNIVGSILQPQRNKLKSAYFNFKRNQELLTGIPSFFYEGEYYGFECYRNTAHDLSPQLHLSFEEYLRNSKKYLSDELFIRHYIDCVFKKVTSEYELKQYIPYEFLQGFLYRMQFDSRELYQKPLEIQKFNNILNFYKVINKL